MQIELKYTLSRALRLKMIRSNLLVLKMNLINFFLSLFIYAFSGLCWILLLLLLWITVGAVMVVLWAVALAIVTIAACYGIDLMKILEER